MYCFLLVVQALVIAGCAGKPWTTPLEGERRAETGRLVESMLSDSKSCEQSIEADLALFYADPLEKMALNGYLRFSLPGSYMFVVANPFGQTVLAIAGDQSVYQSVNVAERIYTTGSLRSFGIRHKLPMEILQGHWGEWLTARSLRPASAIAAVYEDKKGRGLWISFRHEKPEPAGMSHLLIDPAENLLLARFLEDSRGKIVAEITYDDWAHAGKCRQPRKIHIAGLDYGVDIRFELSNIQLGAETRKYSLPVPAGYTQHLLP